MDRTLSDSWTGFTKFTLLSDKPQPGYTWFGERPTKIQATARPGYLWPEISIGMSEAAKKKEKQGWTVEKPKLDNVRKLRGFFSDPEDGEYKETIKNARKRLKVPVEAAVHRVMKTRKRAKKLRETVAGENTNFMESHETRWKRLESTLPRNHQDHIAEKRFNSITHYKLVHKLFPCLSDENSRCKSRSGQGMEEVRDNPSMATGENQEQEGGH